MVAIRAIDVMKEGHDGSGVGLFLADLRSLLDEIKFVRISMLTDPALDAGRHEFELRTLLGRILPPEEIAERFANSNWLPPVREIYPLVIGSMSFGALSPNMWEGLQLGVAYLNEELGMPVRFCTGEGGRTAATAIDDLIKRRYETYDRLPAIDQRRVKLEYYDPRILDFADPAACPQQCASFGKCRDCGLCESICPEAAITRRDLADGDYEYAAAPDRCIGCGFCAGACQTGVWALVEN